ncbi:hypothetical protein NDU88_003915 [Pleurodeles waltl]|uniref:Uncharacterized protein n=1 Tax=Pleurodeles waltl TaxID=8319 RepID=A0AAV7MA52_PLEWA|nr:hypothetical protein NDU88_003915 [Pleurodeles waltl]
MEKHQSSNYSKIDPAQDPPPASEITLENILIAMQQSLQSIDGKNNYLNIRIDDMAATLDKQTTWHTTAEQAISNTEADLEFVTSKSLDMEKVLVVIHAKIEDLEV